MSESLIDATVITRLHRRRYHATTHSRRIVVTVGAIVEWRRSVIQPQTPSRMPPVRRAVVVNRRSYTFNMARCDGHITLTYEGRHWLKNGVITYDASMAVGQRPLRRRHE